MKNLKRKISLGLTGLALIFSTGCTLSKSSQMHETIDNAKYFGKLMREGAYNQKSMESKAEISDIFLDKEFKKTLEQKKELKRTYRMLNINSENPTLKQKTILYELFICSFTDPKIY